MTWMIHTILGFQTAIGWGNSHYLLNSNYDSLFASK